MKIGNFRKNEFGDFFLYYLIKELMALVIGNENYDWEKLEEVCEYKEGFTKDHQTIKFFWDVFR